MDAHQQPVAQLTSDYVPLSTLAQVGLFHRGSYSPNANGTGLGSKILGFEPKRDAGAKTMLELSHLRTDSIPFFTRFVPEILAVPIL